MSRLVYATLGAGACLITYALASPLSLLSAPLEWVGVFVVFSTLTRLLTLRLSLGLASLSFTAGLLGDWAIIGSELTLTDWGVVNLMVLLSALAGSLTGRLSYESCTQTSALPSD